jgi:hypothetical protein
MLWAAALHGLRACMLWAACRALVARCLRELGWGAYLGEGSVLFRRRVGALLSAGSAVGTLPRAGTC